MRILVTGAAGFIGSHVSDRLLAAGHEVIGLDNLSRGNLENLRNAQATGRFQFEQMDVTAPELAAVVGRINPEVVCHLAAQIDVRVSVTDPVFDVQQNVVGTVNLLDAARKSGCGKVVFTSSGGAIYGNPASLPVNETAPLAPESPYAASKAACELFLGTFAALYGLRWTSLALSNVYGPRQDPHGEAGVVAIFASALLESKTAMIFGDGQATRDFVYVGDVADAFALAVTNGAHDGRRFNIGTGQQTSVAELYAEIASQLKSDRKPTYADARAGELRASSLDATAARESLGWTPATTLEAGLARTIEWIAQA